MRLPVGDAVMTEWGGARDVFAQLAALEAEFPPWHVWVGVTGVLYARVPNSAVPLQRAGTVAELRALMAAEQARWKP